MIIGDYYWAPIRFLITTANTLSLAAKMRATKIEITITASVDKNVCARVGHTTCLISAIVSLM
jgi:hypothetical protein